MARGAEAGTGRWKEVEKAIGKTWNARDEFRNAATRASQDRFEIISEIVRWARTKFPLPFPLSNILFDPNEKKKKEKKNREKIFRGKRREREREIQFGTYVNENCTKFVIPVSRLEKYYVIIKSFERKLNHRKYEEALKVRTSFSSVKTRAKNS